MLVRMLGAWKFLAHSKDIHKTLKSHELSHSMLTGYLWNHSRDVGTNLLLKKFGRMWNVSADRNILPSFDVWRFLTKSLTANPGNGQVLLSSCFGCQRRTTTRLLWLSLFRLALKSGFRNCEFCILGTQLCFAHLQICMFETGSSIGRYRAECFILRFQWHRDTLWPLYFWSWFDSCKVAKMLSSLQRPWK